MIVKLVKSMQGEAGCMNESMSSSNLRLDALEDASRELNVRFEGHAARFSVLSSRVQQARTPPKLPGCSPLVGADFWGGSGSWKTK